MWQLAVLTPVALLLLMLLLGRFESWLDRTTPPPPPRREHGRWRRTSRSVRSSAAGEVGVGRRLLAHRPRGTARRRPVVGAPRTTVAVARADRRHVLRGRLRSGR